MQKISRRKFVGTSAMGALAISTMPLESFNPSSTPFNWPLCFQAWGVKDLLAKDFDNTLRKIQAIGFKGIEMCSPPGYSDSGFGPLTKMTASEIRKKIEDAGLFCKTSHFQHWEVKSDALQKTIEYAKELGLHDITLSGISLSDDSPYDKWKQTVDELNESASKIKSAGLQFVYHNHTIGPEVNGEQLYDILMRLFNPELVKMQFQVACISEGFDIIKYIRKYQGRFISLHMHDWDKKKNKIVPLGKGIVDWKKLLLTAKDSGIAEYGMILELESRPPDDPVQDLAVSYSYLQTLGL